MTMCCYVDKYDNTINKINKKDPLITIKNKNQSKQYDIEQYPEESVEERSLISPRSCQMDIKKKKYKRNPSLEKSKKRRKAFILRRQREDASDSESLTSGSCSEEENENTDKYKKYNKRISKHHFRQPDYQYDIYYKELSRNVLKNLPSFVLFADNFTTKSSSYAYSDSAMNAGELKARRNSFSDVIGKKTSSNFSNLVCNDKTEQIIPSASAKCSMEMNTTKRTLEIVYWTRSDEVKERKWDHLDYIDAYFPSREEYIRNTTLYKIDTVIEPNMFPYDTPAGIEHWTLWSIYEMNEYQIEKYVSSWIDINAKHVVEWNYDDNPERSIHLFHVHVYFKVLPNEKVVYHPLVNSRAGKSNNTQCSNTNSMYQNKRRKILLDNDYRPNNIIPVITARSKSQDSSFHK